MSNTVVSDGWTIETSDGTPTSITAETVSAPVETADLHPVEASDAPDTSESAVEERRRDERGRFASSTSETPANPQETVEEQPISAETSTTTEAKPSKRTPEGRKQALQQEIDTLTRTRRELERQIEAARQRQPPPREERFEPPHFYQPGKATFPAYEAWAEAERAAGRDDGYERYGDERADWRADQKIEAYKNQIAAEQAERAQQTRIADLRDKGKSEYTDWDDAFSAAGDVEIPLPLTQAILSDPDAHRLAYALAKDPEFAASLRHLDPLSAGMALGTLKARVAGAIAAPPSPSQSSPLPAPIRPLGSSPTQPTTSLDDVPFEKWTPEMIRKANEADRKTRRL